MSHVPDEHLPEYRRLKTAHDLYDNLGNNLSNIGFYDEANTAWGKAAEYGRRAQGLRA